MESQVIFRDRQELQSADFNNTGAFAAAAKQHLVQDAVSEALHFTGGICTARSATELDVAALRFYNDGQVYASEQTETLNLFQYLPLVTKKCVAVVVWGEVKETEVEPRDFLVDLTTGATEPQAVAMIRRCVANINLQPGTESVDPQPPAIQTATLAIALVYLTPTGIERIEMQDGFRLPNLYAHEQRMHEVERWRGEAEPRISSIATDLAALSQRTDGLVSRATVLELASDLARVKAKANLPASYASYESDYFVDDTKTDADGAGYLAYVNEGLLFPISGQASAGLALFNPYDAAVSRSADDLVLPIHTHVARIKTTGYSGDISASQYQVQSQTVKKYTTPAYRYHYGWHWNYYPAWYNGLHAGLNIGLTLLRKLRWGYYIRQPVTTYQLETTTSNYNGAIIGQSFLVSNAMWLTQVGLQFTQIGASGDVTLAVCETDGGKPDLLKTLTTVTVARGDLKKYPTETRVPVPPVLLDAGKRYAVVIITQGDHRLAVVSGNNYTQGTLFFGTDGDFFTGDLTKDLMLTLYAAQFDQPRVEVMLQSVSLAGGMSDIAIEAPQVVPDGTELRYEIQVAGKWYPLGDEIMRLAGLPDIVPLRVVLLGTSDLAPALRLTPNAVVGSRAGTSLLHWSALRTLSSASSTITVQVVVAQWDAANHSLACALISGANTYTPATTTVRDEPDGQARRITYVFTPPAITTYQVRLTGTRTPSSLPFVIVERTDVAT